MSMDSVREAVEDRRKTRENQELIDRIGDLRLQHPIADLANARLSHLLRPNNGIEIIAVLGSSGVGKTTLFTSDYSRAMVDLFNRSGGLLHFEAPQLGQVKIMIKAFYWMALQAGHEPMLDQKIHYEVKGGRLNIASTSNRGPSVLALRQNLVNMLKYRDVLALVVDEVMHLLRVKNTDIALDMVKGIASEKCPKIIVIGDMNMPGRTAAYEQFMRRGRTVYVPRYDHILAKIDDSIGRKKICKTMLEGFSVILEKYQSNWPFRNVPDFKKENKKLLVESLGNFGLIRQIVISCLEFQMAAGGKWMTGFIEASFMPNTTRQELEQSYLAGDEVMRRYGWEGGMSVDAFMPGEAAS